MDKITYRLVYNRRKILNMRGQALVQVEAYLKGSRKYFSTNVYLRPNQWNYHRQLVVRHPNADALNHLLDEMLMKLEQTEIDLWKKGRAVSLDALKGAVYANAQDGDFLAFFGQEVQNASLKPSTKKNHQSTLCMLRQFRHHLSFSDITYEFLLSFEAFLTSHHYHINTVAKHMKHLKRYVNIAINKELMEVQGNPFRKYAIKTVDNKCSFLTPDEVAALEQLSLKGKYQKLQKTLDAFLFCCYVGMRYSDFVSIRDKNFYVLKGDTWLSYQSVKTGIRVRVPLNHTFGGKPLKLLEKYRGNLSAFFLLKDNSNINKELTRLAALAHIDKGISFHTARHTNASLLIYKGVNITTVQKLLGHKNVKTTQIYTHVMDMTIIRDLKRCKDEYRGCHLKSRISKTFK